MTTKQAFKKLLKTLENKREDETQKLLGKTPAAIRYIRYSFTQDKVSLDKMEEILKKAGAKKTPEHWDFPNDI